MSSSCGVEFVEMTSNVVFFPHSPSLSEVVVKVKEVLGWSDIGDDIVLEGRYDAGGSRSFTQMIPSMTKTSGIYTRSLLTAHKSNHWWWLPLR